MNEGTLTNLAKQQRLLYWCQKVLPAVYDDSLSYYELLNKVVDYLNQLVDKYNVMVDATNQNTADIADLKQAVQDLQEELDKVKNGDYVSLYLNSIIKWIDDNFINLVGRIVKFVSFGISKEGYFQAYIPTSWRFLQFDTGAVYGKADYGCLKISW